MCSIVVLNRPDHDWPILIAANRDERHDRLWKKPAAHWSDRPDIVAGLDVQAGGSWLGMNADGVVAAILNREGSLGPQDGKRSRGELVLDALDHVDAINAAEALRGIERKAYRPFNMVVADNRDALLLIHRDASGKSPVSVQFLPEGLTMVTSKDADDPNSPRIRLYRPKFLAVPTPDPDRGDWTSWETLLASRERDIGAPPSGALFIDGVPASDPDRFGTTSSSLIALPSIERDRLDPIWRFTSGAPEDWVWEEIGR